MELGEEVEGLLEIRQEKKQGKKTTMVPRFTLSEILNDSFEIPIDLRMESQGISVSGGDSEGKRYRDPRQAMLQSTGDFSESYEISIEDVL